MNKILEMVLSMVIKKGVAYEAHNCDFDVEVPNGDEKIKINFKADNMKLYVQKEEAK